MLLYFDTNLYLELLDVDIINAAKLQHRIMLSV